MRTKFSPSDEADRIVVRCPDGMRASLKALAKANHRSVNAEIVFRLGEVLANVDSVRAPQEAAHVR